MTTLPTAPDTVSTDTSQVEQPTEEKRSFDVTSVLRDHPEFQSWLDQKMAEARKQGRSSKEKDLLNEFGVDDKAKVKALIDAERERQNAEMSEIERLQATLKEFEQKVALVEQQKAEAATRLIEERINAAIRDAAHTHGIRPDDALLFIKRDGIVVGDDGTIRGVDQQVRSLLADKPYLKIESRNAPPPTPNPASDSAKSDGKKTEARQNTWKPRFN